MGDAYLALGERDNAIAEYEIAAGLSRNRADADLAVGDLYEIYGELEMAEAAYRQAQGADPSSLTAHIALGQVLQQKEQYGAALAEYEAASELNRGAAWPVLMQGHLYSALGDTTLATDAYRRAIATEPGNVSGYINVGNKFRQELEHEAAMALYEQALAVYPGSAWVREIIGYAYKQRQMYDEALESFTQSLVLDPARSGSYAAMASIYQVWNDPRETAVHFDSQSQQQPDVPWYSGLAAQIYRDLDAVEKATEHYENLLTFVPHYADAHYNLALLYERGSDARAAVRHWNIYLALAAGSQYGEEAETRREALRRVVITDPTDEESVDGQVPIFGSAWLDDFWYYKIEFQRPASDQWQVIGELHYEPVTDGLLGTWDTTGLAEGTYRLRLVVVNLVGQFVPPYELLVTIGP
jgi:tetratricopeptide (TPR) repeat protein